MPLADGEGVAGATTQQKPFEAIAARFTVDGDLPGKLGDGWGVGEYALSCRGQCKYGAGDHGDVTAMREGGFEREFEIDLFLTRVTSSFSFIATAAPKFSDVGSWGGGRFAAVFKRELIEGDIIRRSHFPRYRQIIRWEDGDTRNYSRRNANGRLDRGDLLTIHDIESSLSLRDDRHVDGSYTITQDGNFIRLGAVAGSSGFFHQTLDGAILDITDNGVRLVGFKTQRNFPLEPRDSRDSVRPEVIEAALSAFFSAQVTKVWVAERAKKARHIHRLWARDP